MPTKSGGGVGSGIALHTAAAIAWRGEGGHGVAALDGGGQRGGGRERNLEHGESCGVGHAADTFQYGDIARDAEERGAGGELRGGVQQCGAEFLGIGRHADTADGLVQQVGEIAAGALARFDEERVGLHRQRRETVFQKLADRRLEGAGSHSCLHSNKVRGGRIMRAKIQIWNHSRERRP
jgi:hypothetical protein